MEKAYHFTSIGENGKSIEKVVAFQQMNMLLYNLALADYDVENDDYDDNANSNNYDMSKVFATIFRIVRDFLEEYPHYHIYIEGNSPIKKRLYQRIIKGNLISLQNNYSILGVISSEAFEKFTPENEYNGFIIHKK
ncbi:MAG: hypothetical protein EAZ95_05065 [Bacteroidetes bacterium]|nr:MAG: hypothetical protein EAZ95_05065 [Bacteroidota bacterium]